jgi:heme-degrading monooxygenase HmoA
MYIRLSRLFCDPGQCDEVLRGAEQTNGALRNLPGLQSSYWGVDRATGSMIAVSVWDTPEHASFSRDDLIAAAGRAGSPNAGPAAEGTSANERCSHGSTGALRTYRRRLLNDTQLRYWTGNLEDLAC